MKEDRVRLGERVLVLDHCGKQLDQLADTAVPAPLLMSGERRREGLGCSDIPIEPNRDELCMRVTARAVYRMEHRRYLGVSVLDAFDKPPDIRTIKRAAYACCPFAGDDEMYTLGQHHPDN